MNIPVTIPKELTRGEELVIIPRRLYDEFKHMLKKIKASPSSLELQLEKALKEVGEGKIVGPFSKSKELLKSLRANK